MVKQRVLRRAERSPAHAIACFARQGFHSTTMQDVVAETGQSAGAIYRFRRGCRGRAAPARARLARTAVIALIDAIISPARN
jgi:Bacterial regulatory proteins, tetR family